jgi:hypothetical protein
MARSLGLSMTTVGKLLLQLSLIFRRRVRTSRQRLHSRKSILRYFLLTRSSNTNSTDNHNGTIKSRPPSNQRLPPPISVDTTPLHLMSHTTPINHSTTPPRSPTRRPHSAPHPLRSHCPSTSILDTCRGNTRTTGPPQRSRTTHLQ